MHLHNHISVIVFILISTLAFTNSISIRGSFDPATERYVRGLAFAYTLDNPDASFEITSSTEFQPSTFQAIIDDELEFSLGSLAYPFTTEEAIRNASLFSLPILTTPIVTSYRLDTLGANTVPVILTMDVIAQIFMGLILTWYDPQIVSINANITLPSQNITIIVSDDLTGEAESASQAMAGIKSYFSSLITPGLLPNWPFEEYSSYVRCSGDDCVTAAVSLVDGSIGWTALGNALDHKLSYASILKSDQVVIASDTSSSFAFVELAPLAVTVGIVTAITLPLPQSLVNPLGAQAWSINRMAWLTHKMVYQGDDELCEQKAVMLSFLLFMLQSPQSKQVMTASQLAGIPDVGLTSLDAIVTSLNTFIFCNNVSLAVIAADLNLPYATANVVPETISGPLQAAKLFQLLQTFLVSVSMYTGDNSELLYTPTRSTSTSYELVKSGSVSSGLIVLEDLDLQQRSELADMTSRGQFILLPLFAFAVTPIYSRAVVDVNGIVQQLPSSLKLDVDSVAALLTGQMTSWKDLSYLNPSLKTLNAYVRPVWACGDDGLVATTVPLTLLMAYQSGASLPSSFAAADTFMCNSSLFSSNAFIDIQPSGVFATPVESSESSILSVAQGGFSATIWDPVQSDVTGVGIAQMTFERGGTNASSFLVPSVTSMLSCFDAFDAASLTTDVMSSASSQCYKFTRPIYIYLPASYNDTSQNSCADVQASLRTILAILETPELSSLLSTQGLARPSDIPAVSLAIRSKLNQVQCIDTVTGESFSVLVRLPDVWSPSSALTIAALIVGAIGIFLSIISLVFVTIYRYHPAIAVSSVVFLVLTIVGTVLVQIASILMTLEATPKVCVALDWIAQLGFALMLMPVFVQCYRVYTIWGHANLRVVKISNQRLLGYIVIELLIEVVLLGAAQIISPLQPVESLYTDDSARVHSCTICGLDSQLGSAIFGVQAGLKGLLLLFGAVYGFSSRAISEKFNQSSRIAFTIYNCLLTVCVVVLVIALANVRGDALVGLIAFGGLWIAIITQLLTFVPRIRAVISSHIISQPDEQAAEGEGGFSLLSAAAFTTPESMTQYRDAIDAQLVKARARLATLQGDGGSTRKSVKSKPNLFVQNPSVMSDTESQNSDKPKLPRSSSNVSTTAKPGQLAAIAAQTKQAARSSPFVSPITSKLGSTPPLGPLSPSNARLADKTLTVPPNNVFKPVLKPRQSDIETKEQSRHSDSVEMSSPASADSGRPLSAKDDLPQVKINRSMSRKASA